MKRKLPNITNKIISFCGIAVLLFIWQMISGVGIVPKYMLPSPTDVVRAFISDFPLLMSHMKTTLGEAAFGLITGILVGFLVAVIMEWFPIVYKLLYPLVVISQTIPTIAIAPLLVLWLGFGMMPKVVLVVLSTFFPVTIGLLDGFRSTDEDTLRLMKAMGASNLQIFTIVKVPSALSHFFAGLRISVAYSIVVTVVSEWLGGFYGLGVYMTRVRKSYAFDKMFAVIFLISGISLLLMTFVDVLQRICMPWENKEL